MDDVERTLPATERRRAWAREQGYSARSAALTGAVVLATMSSLWLAAGPAAVDQIAASIRDTRYANVTVSVSPEQAIEQATASVLEIGLVGLAGMVLTTLAALTVNLAQSGFQWSTVPLAPDVSRIDPGRGLSRLASTDNALAALWSLLILSAASVAGFVAISTASAPRSLWSGSLETVVVEVTSGAASTALQLSAVVVVLSGLDVARRRWSLERSLRMTAVEQREETGARPKRRSS
jgi:flagellar biosynthesis protein FlhB